MHFRLICKGEEITRLTNNIETPPTTPDSFTTSLTTSTANTVNASQIISNETKIIASSNVKQEAGAKYSPNPLVVCFPFYKLFLLHYCYYIM